VIPPIEQIRLKVTRSRKHVDELEASVATFLRRKPYQVATKREPGTRRLIYFVSRVDEVPLEIAVAAGDALQNLRSALDHLAYRLVLLRTGGAVPMSHVYFPIAESLAKYDQIKKNYLNGVSAHVMGAVDAIKPYRGGTDALWRLHQSNIIDKHRLLLTVGAAFRSFDLGASMQQHIERAFPESDEGTRLRVPSFFVRPADRMFPIKIGDELFIDAPDAEPNEKMEFRFEVAIQEPKADLLNGEPLIDTLGGFVAVVDDTINQLAPMI
jgi:hypothetical protein